MAWAGPHVHYGRLGRPPTSPFRKVPSLEKREPSSIGGVLSARLRAPLGTAPTGRIVPQGTVHLRRVRNRSMAQKLGPILPELHRCFMTTSDREHEGWEPSMPFLLSCPFCNGAGFAQEHVGTRLKPHVTCDDCGADIAAKTLAEAVELWNSRSPVLGGGGEGKQDQDVMASVAQSAAGSASHDAASETPCQSEGLARSGLAKIALAAWCNVRPDQLPAEKAWIDHPNDENRKAWDRVAAAMLSARPAVEGDGLTKLIEAAMWSPATGPVDWSADNVAAMKDQAANLARAILSYLGGHHE